MQKYDHSKIEKKWQAKWDADDAYTAKDDGKEKKYLLIEFPYPSGDGLHVGHIRSWTALDVVARKYRAEGKNVMYPIGWDAFGLPAENYAIKTGVHPKITTKQNTENFKRQIKNLGISFDWSREINTTDPEYYQWTQWIFIQMFKKGLAYKTKTLINWCPKDKVTLANEEVLDGTCERCGTPVEKKEKEQWMLAITKYAQRLYDDLDTVDYITPAKVGQRNWIGPSEGAEIEFALKASDKKIKVFTTRPDTLFGATYLVLAPEHPLVSELAHDAPNKSQIIEYVFAAKNKSDIERSAEGKEKTGVALEGVHAVNPVTKGEVPVYIADYVLGAYGTGAIMAVPAHDERDYAFATAFNLPIVEVIEKGDATLPYTGYGNLINSEKFDGMESAEAKKEIADFAQGNMVTTFKLRDWVFGRQRYWGEPIPMVHCVTDGWVPVPESELPVLLPQTDTFLPGTEGESPLASMDAWVQTTCPVCKGPARRETDVMPQWAGSSWYYLRYADSKNNTAFASKEKLKYWSPVDWYNGGMEHTTLHLLYSRFWHKFLFDIGEVPTPEPYAKRTSHGLILAEGGEKMSKSKGNTVSPDALVDTFGADSLRLYEMFIGPFDQPVAWSTNSILGVRRFIERVWGLQEKVKESALLPQTETLMHQTIEKVSKDIESLKMNTAVSALMIYSNHLAELAEIPTVAFISLLQLLQPFAPHLVNEIVELNSYTTAELTKWPAFDASKTHAATVTIGVQVNGKVRGTVELSSTATEEEALSIARSNETIAKWLAGGQEKKAVYVAGKIINFVVG